MTNETVALQTIDALTEIHDALTAGHPLAAVDLAISYLDTHGTQKQQRNALRLLGRAALKHLGLCVQESEFSLESLFEPQFPHPAKRFIAICLIRALHQNPNLFIEPVFRNRSFNLFDVTLPDIYKDTRIASKTQTHEKEAALRTYVTDVEQQLTEIFRPVDALTPPTWDNLVPLKQNLQRFIKKFGGFLAPFIPHDLVDAVMDQMFTAIRDYFEAQDDALVREFQRVNVTIASYKQRALEEHTRYSRDLCARLADVLDEACQFRFNESGAGKPAIVGMKPSEKKYPFHSIGRLLNLGIILENIGPGYAQEVMCSIEVEAEAEVQRTGFFLGNLKVGQITVEFPVLIKEPVTSLIAEVTWNWKNFDGTEASSSSLVELQGQLAEIDWEPLAFEEPYSLEPVSSEKTLVGRSEVLAQLVAKASGSSVGSACLTGQRRVGKTSIAKTLKSRLVNELGNKIMVLFIEAGEYVHPEARATIEKLGTKLCKQIILSDKRLTNVTRPVFDGALSPITDFFDECLSIIPDIRIVIILDEFDSVPPDLYRRGPTGEAFFSTIRSLSQKGNVGFILIGGERMRYLTDCQGQALNKFQIIRVDYFDRSRYWTDYQELITRPTRHCLQFTDSALQYIYTMSAGNPYYTILICRSLFNLMVSRRDSHITERDAMEGVAQAIREASTTSFQHFWEDGIVAGGAEMEDISMRRRFVLLALAEAHRGKKSASRDEIAKAAEIYGLDARSVENELSEFVQREILINTNGQYRCKVPLFSSWLQSVGPRQISTTYTEAEAVRILRQREDDSEVRAAEIVKLAETWQPYKGRRISAEDVRGWLDQFGRKSDQRLMFRVLENVRFFSDDEVRDWMKVAQGIVTRGLVDRVAHKQVKRWQSILVGYLDGPAKSGSYLAKLYVDENGMFADCVTEKEQIVPTLSKRDDIQALVFVDDYVGTGKSSCDYVDEMIDKCKAVLLAKKVRLFFLAVAGTEAGIQKLEEHIAQSGVDIRVHVNMRLGAKEICFGAESRVFPDPHERLRAQDVAERIGLGLCRRDPLGFSNSQAVVVFSHNCPNNSLPILWERSANWIPLFRRD